MYNKERKTQYLKEKSETSILSNNISNAFDLSERFEEKYGRDICEWTSGEIISFYKYIGTSYIQTLVQLNNALSGYANWCMVNGLISDNQNHFADINSEMLCKCIDMKSLGSIVVTREKLNEIDELRNFCDQFILLGLFEGIPVKDDIMKSVKLSDLDGNTIHLKNGVDLEISDKLRSIMYKADEEDTWMSYKDKRGVEISYQNDGCIIRYTKTKGGKVSTSSSTVIIGMRLRKAIKFLGWSENITIKSIMESGRIDMMRKLAKEYNVPIEDTLRTLHIRKIHERIYGKVQNHSTWLSTYGRFLGSSVEQPIDNQWIAKK